MGLKEENVETRKGNLRNWKKKLKKKSTREE